MIRNAPDIPDYVNDVYEETARLKLKGLWRNRRRFKHNSPILVSVIKNEINHLPHFLGHYRDLGIRQFVILDNGSQDGSVEFLSAQPDVHMYYVDRPYTWARKQGWVHKIITAYGRQNWYVCVDADEHLVFDRSEHRSLGELASLMDRLAIRRVRGMLIDMYAGGPMLHYSVQSDRPLHESFSLFDTDSYEERQVARMVSRKGGPRRRCLSTVDTDLDPELTKYPLFRLRRGEVMANPHHLYPYPENFQSPCYLGILHYKFLPGLMRRIDTAIAEGNYWDESAEYKAYRACLKAAPNMSLEYEGTARYRSPENLIQSGLIEPVNWLG